MRLVNNLLFAGALTILTTGAARADDDPIRVPLLNLSNQAEPGLGVAGIVLERGEAQIDMLELQQVPHDNPLGSGRIMGYAAWLVNSENALGKMNLGFLFPDGDGRARLRFSASSSKRTDLTSQGFNMVVITAETTLDLARPQPSGPPIAAGQIPGTPAAVTAPPAVEVFMGDLNHDVFGFSEPTITIFSGQSVRWTNVSPEFITAHTATRTEAGDGTAFGGDQEFDSGAVPFGGAFTRTFTLPAGAPAGIFNYHCTPHQALGMVGRIVIIAKPTKCAAALTGNAETPPVTTSARGSATITLNPTQMTLTYDVTASGLTGIAAHIHEAPAGTAGPIRFPLVGGPTRWTGKTAALTAEQKATLLSGGFYVNVHTDANKGGEIRGQISCEK
jgi:plastocyanin